MPYENIFKYLKITKKKIFSNDYELLLTYGGRMGYLYLRCTSGTRIINTVLYIKNTMKKRLMPVTLLFRLSKHKRWWVFSP